MTIYYGSQSGTAEGFANELATEAKSQGFLAKAVDVEEFDEEALPQEKLIVFLMATFGEGEPTDNAIKFFDWLTNEDREDGLFTGVNFAVFALGNRQYEHFCAVGRKVFKRLRQLGGKEVLDLGEGDDDGSLEDDYAQWKSKFWPAVRARYDLGESKVSSEEESFQPTLRVKFEGEQASEDMSSNDELKMSEWSAGVKAFAGAQDPKHKVEVATVLVNKELRKDLNEGSTRHLEIDIRSLRLRYHTADNLTVHPRNHPDTVAALCARFKLQPNQVIVIDKSGSSSVKVALPSTCTVADALAWYCDVNKLCSTRICKTLAQYATNKDDELKLLSYTAENKEQFQKEERSIYEMLLNFPALNVPFEHFLEWVPKIQPRFYTISSSSEAEPDTIHITVALTMVKKADGRVHRGVCSDYLCSLSPGDLVCVGVKESSFRLPQTSQTPVIMVGPGTGVAPFRAFLQEAAHVATKGKKLGPLTLFFGCRHRDQDFLYRDELEGHHEQDVGRLVTAFSRENEEKMYVQHRLEHMGQEMWQLISEQKAYFYVCGGTSMGRSVRECVVALAQKYGGMTLEQAQAFVADMQDKHKRYVAELWSS